eukprot:scaffold85247_cov22-Tisochrysis_lutea.AAC.1
MAAISSTFPDLPDKLGASACKEVVGSVQGHSGWERGECSVTPNAWCWAQENQGPRTGGVGANVTTSSVLAADEHEREELLGPYLEGVGEERSSSSPFLRSSAASTRPVADLVSCVEVRSAKHLAPRARVAKQAFLRWAGRMLRD